MIKSDNVEVTTGQLAPADPVETGTGERYIHYIGQNISRDSVIDIRIASLSNNTSFIVLLLIAVLAITIVAGVVFIIKRRKSVGRHQESNGNGVKG